jgi:hypothetical protein
MSTIPRPHDELRSLLDLLCHGDVTADDVQRIQVLALASVESRGVFAQAMQLHAALAWQFRDPPLLSSPPNVARNSPILGFLGASADKTWGSQALHLWPLAVGVAICFWAFWGYVIHANRQPWDHRTAAQSGAAQVVQASGNCLWNHATPIQAGDKLAVGKTLRLTAGQLELAFDSGAHGILEGPADFEIRSHNGGYLRLGKLTARVPRQAIGFAVETPTALVVDLGTEFGVEVDARGETEVQVFKGAVDFASTDAAKLKQGQARAPGRRLEAGQAAQTGGPAKEIVATNFLPGRFSRRVNQAQPLRRDVPIDLHGAKVTQSSLYPGGGFLPEEAIDGDRQTYSVTSNEEKSSAWWRLDLGRSRPVSSIVLHNDPTQRGWLRDIRVNLLADDGKTVVARSPLLNPKNCRGEGEESFDHGPSQLTFDFPREQGDPPLGRFVLVEREPCTLDPSRMKTDRGSGFLAGCRAGLTLGEVEVFELGNATAADAAKKAQALTGSGNN